MDQYWSNKPVICAQILSDRPKVLLNFGGSIGRSIHIFCKHPEWLRLLSIYKCHRNKVCLLAIDLKFMNAKQLRILLVDRCQDKTYVIERMLNACGFYGVAIARSLSEAIDYAGFPGRGFDVVIFDSEIINSSSRFVLALSSDQSRPGLIMCYGGQGGAVPESAFIDIGNIYYVSSVGEILGVLEANFFSLVADLP